MMSSSGRERSMTSPVFSMINLTLQVEKWVSAAILIFRRNTPILLYVFVLHGEVEIAQRIFRIHN